MIIGITGTDGAGKGTVVEYLVQEKGFTHYSARALISEEILRRGLEVDRDTLRTVGNSMRSVDRAVLVNTYTVRMKEEGVENAIIESIRATWEVDALHEKGGVLIAVDADQEVRYERITVRGSSTDTVSYERFVQQEELEMNDSDPHGMQKAKVMEMADYTITNNGTREELHAQVEDVLRQIKSD